jgi:hypothetical protein
MQQGRHIAHKFESGWEVGVIKAFDKVKYSQGWSKLRVMEKTSTGFDYIPRVVLLKSLPWLTKDRTKPSGNTFSGENILYQLGSDSYPEGTSKYLFPGPGR